MAEDRGFLARWSERKRQARAERLPPEPTEVADAEAAALAEEEAANRAVAEAIDIDSLGAGDDFTVFLKRGVPDALKRRALHRLWRTDPVLACLDGLNDYDQNFADPSLNMSVFKSAWQVGKGYVTEEPEAAPAETAETPAEPPADEPAAPEQIAEAEPVPEQIELESPEPDEERPRVSLRRRLGLDDA